MNKIIERDEWNSYLMEFNKRNQSRSTWLQVFGELGAQSEEQGLPLMGICVDMKGADAPYIQIMLGGHDAIEPLHLTHVVSNVEKIAPEIGIDGRENAIEFINKKGEASLLIFKHRAWNTAQLST